MTFIILFFLGAAVVLALTVGLALLVGRRPTTTVAPPPAPPRPAPEAPPKAPPKAPPAPPAAPPRAKPAPIEAPPAPAALPAEVVEAPPAAPPAPPAAPPAPPAVEPEAKPSVATRFLRSLTRSRTVLGERLGAIMSRGKLDEEAWEEVEEALIRADVGVAATDAILQSLRRQKLKPEELGEALRAELVGILDRTDRTFRFSDKGPTVWLVAGVNGTGKTTSIAKLARMLQTEGKTVVLAAADTFRAAAIDQLGTWAERLGVHMIRHASGADPGAVVFDAVEYALARSIDVVIVDTAGRLHTKTSLMDELKKIRRIAERKGEVTEALLVLDATVGQNGIAQARTFGEAVQVTGVILTKLDGSARGGIVVAVQEELGIPVKAVGIGEQMADLELFDPKAFVDALVEVPGDAA
ncbi:MAG: signal recognition particle-docking protein FtsY [Actinobacteria bacterium]|nr:MAG: signal recognition particle-docking protein FtsY [Actinomycetota bacterium]